MQRKSPPCAVGQLLLDQIETRRRAKARGRIAKMLAGKAGKTKRMPPCGKAALAAIAAGKW